MFQQKYNEYTYRFNMYQEHAYNGSLKRVDDRYYEVLIITLTLH